MIAASDLGRRFGRHWALARVELEVARGQSLLLAGSNGSGKTTLLRLLAGLYRPSRGRLRVLGLDPWHDRRRCRRSLSMLSHDPYLYPRLTALETTRLWARFLRRPAADGDLIPYLEEVELDRRRDSPVGTFSAGMRKRLALVRIRLEQPEVVLLDEPFSALDVPGRRLVGNWLDGFHASGVTVVMASHSLRAAARYCDRAVLLDRGQVAWRGPANELEQRMEACA